MRKVRFFSGILSGLVLAFLSANAFSQDTLQVPVISQPKGTIVGTGTSFSVNNSEYLNVTLVSSVEVGVIISSAPSMITISVDSIANADSATWTIQGFPVNTTFHKYEDNLHQHQVLTSDADGVIIFKQDVQKRHVIFIQPRPSTYFLKADGWYHNAVADPTAGSWNSITKTATLTHNLNESIQFDVDGVTLDGAGYSLTLTTATNGILIPEFRKNVTIKNLVIKNTTYAIHAIGNDTNITISNCKFDTYSQYAILGGDDWSGYSATYRGLVNSQIVGNTFATNSGSGTLWRMSGKNCTIAQNVLPYAGATAMCFYDLSNSTIEKNIVQNYNLGIQLIRGTNCLIQHNTVTGGRTWGIRFDGTTNTRIYLNDISVPVGNCDGIEVYYGYTTSGATIGSAQNIIAGNRFTGNYDAIRLNVYSQNNTVYHNYFYGSRSSHIADYTLMNTLNRPMPVGGNYYANPGPNGTSPLAYYPFNGSGWSTTERDTFPLTLIDTSIVDFIDFTPPTTTAGISSGTLGTNGWYLTDAGITLTATDDIGGSGIKTIQYNINNSGWTTYSAPFQVTTEGTNTIQYQSIDNAGNVEAATNLVVKIDKTAGFVTQSLSGNSVVSGWFITNVGFTLTGYDGVSGVSRVEYSLNGGASWLTFTSGVSLSSEGTTVVNYRMTDNAGNQRTGNFSVSIDKTAPVVGNLTDVVGAGSITIATAPTAVDILAGVVTGTTTDPLTYTTVGTHVVTWTFSDGHGNSVTKTQNAIVTDKTPPVISPISDITIDATGVQTSVTQPIASASDAVDGAVTLVVTWPTTFGVGTTQVIFTATDKAGNSSSKTINVTVSDKISPQISITGVSNGQISKDNLIPLITISDAASGIASQEIKLNGVDFISGTTVTAEGFYTLIVSASDKSGNAAAPVAVSFTIDKTGPDINLSGVENNAFYNSAVIPVVSIDDNGTGIAMKSITLDGNAYVAGSLVDASGVHTLAMSATDNAGNVSSKTITFTLDPSAPVITISGVAEDQISVENITPTIVISDAGSGILTQTITLNGDPFVSGTAVSAEGNFTLAANATDKASNASSQTVHFTIDKTAPLISNIENITQNATGVQTVVTKPAVSATDNVEGAVPVSVNWPASFSLGTTSVTFSASDKAGNTATKTINVIITDKTPPVIANVPAPVTVFATSDNGASVNVPLPTASDNCGGNVTITSNAPAMFPLGMTTVTFTAKDASGNTRTATTTVTVKYNFSGFMQPINTDGSSIFKLGSTVPIKFTATFASGMSSSAIVSQIFVAQISNQVLGSEAEAVSTSNATTGNLFRYDGQQYIFNLSTKNITNGTWQIRAQLNDGTSYLVQISLK